MTCYLISDWLVSLFLLFWCGARCLYASIHCLRIVMISTLRLGEVFAYWPERLKVLRNCCAVEYKSAYTEEIFNLSYWVSSTVNLIDVLMQGGTITVHFYCSFYRIPMTPISIIFVLLDILAMLAFVLSWLITVSLEMTGSWRFLTVNGSTLPKWRALTILISSTQCFCYWYFRRFKYYLLNKLFLIYLEIME